MVETAAINANSCPSYAQDRRPDPQVIAADIVQRNSGPQGPDISAIKRDLAAINAHDGALAAEVSAAVDAQLTPVHRGELARATFSARAPDGNAVAFSDQGMTVAQQFAAPAGSAAAQQYARFDRIWGDGNAATNDTAAIEGGLREMVASGQTLANIEAGGYVPAPAADTQPARPANENAPDTATLVADLVQMSADLVGIVDQTGITDAANGVFSLGRAGASLWNGDGWGALGHVGNGLLSGVSAVPLVGDAAKLGKFGKWAQTVSDAVSAVAHNPALRATFEPAMRSVADAVHAVPQSVIDALPGGARESFETMKSRLDEFFGAGARGADEAAGAATTVGHTANAGRTVRINGQDVTIGSAPSVARRPDGTPTAQNLNGQEVTLNQPRTYDSSTVNADGTVTYSRNGTSVRYDADGFPIFNSRGDVYLPPEKIAVGSRTTHFTESNRLLAQNSDAQLRAAGFSDADISKLRNGETPDDYTWHHHQDMGRMQLVRTSEHEALRGGHSGGWALWGDARRFTVE